MTLKFHVGQRLRVMGVLPNDPAPLEIGDEGEVAYVDDGGTAHVNWDSGRTLGVLPTDPVAVVISLKLTEAEQAFFNEHAVQAYSIHGEDLEFIAETSASPVRGGEADHD